MNIVIAEDEMLERKVMRKFLEENFSAINVVGEASNGRVAIELANRFRPDIMLVDIKMPGINGLEAIEQISKAHPSIKFVLISAYDSFNYAKQAMKLGVKEYILKPSKKEEMVSTLVRVMKEVEEEQKTLEQRAHSVQIAKELFLTKLINHEVSKDVDELQQTLFPQFQSGSFFVIEGAQSLETSALEQVISANTSDAFILQQDQAKQIVLLISREMQTKAYLLQLARQLQIELGEHAYIGVGYPYKNVGHLPDSYQQAIKAVKYLNDRENRQYGFAMAAQENKSELLPSLLTALEAGDEQESLTVFTTIYHSEATKREDLLLELFYKMKQQLEQKVSVLQEQSFYHLKTEQDWQDLLKVTCIQVQHYYHSQDKIERAKTYIEQHYDQPLSLEEISQSIALSTNYFSNLFKEVTGETFIDYLTNLRLQKAKQYLQENHYSLKEISHMVGYKDPNYFSRVFKKNFDLSPKQYQKLILKK